jgi:hypothetical protein
LESLGFTGRPVVDYTKALSPYEHVAVPEVGREPPPHALFDAGRAHRLGLWAERDPSTGRWVIFNEGVG